MAYSQVGRIRPLGTDIDAFSFTRSTIHSRSTVRGLGSISGRAIQAIGEAILTSMDGAVVRARMQYLRTQIMKEKDNAVVFPSSYYTDLFDYQR